MIIPTLLTLTLIGAPGLQYRWVYVQTNFLVDANVSTLDRILDRAHAAGYNGIVVADSKFAFLERMDKHYFGNLARTVAKARQLGLAFYPALSNPGWANDLLSHDPNLAEGMPARDVPFVVHGGEADVGRNPAVQLRNGDFEDSRADQMAGWGFQDLPGQATFADTQVAHSGKKSLRMESPSQTNPGAGNCRINQLVEVAPWRQYHVSAWLKTRNFREASEIRIQALTTSGRPLGFNSLGAQNTQDWTQVHMVFNSQANSQVRLYLGVWGGGRGTMWWDDVRIDEVGLLNVLRRTGCPLVVRGEDGTLYKESRDFEPVADERLGAIPWPGGYEVYHRPPTIRLTAGSRLHEGQKLSVSFYHNVVVYDGSVACCLSDPQVLKLLADSARRLEGAIHPAGFLLSYDEIRNANWCQTCTVRKMTPGQMLAEHFRLAAAEALKLDPKIKLLAWSDMFDPNHNAHGDYYLVNGSWEGSWLGVPPSTVILNWNFGQNADKTLAFFAARGNPQVLAGYYDAAPDRIKDWLNKAEGVKGVVGVMYTTWANNYADLESFAKAAWGQPD